MNRLFETTSKMMKESGTKNIDLANFLQVSAQVFGNWVARESIPEKYAQKIAQFYKTDLNSLYDDEAQSVKKIPITGITNCGESVERKVGKFACYKGGAKAEKLYCAIASGANMSPEIEDGDEIICDLAAKIENGDLVHYKIDGENAVKIYVKDDDADILQLVPYIQSKDFKTKTIRLDGDGLNFTCVKVTAINKLKLRSNQARLKLIGRAI
ncbi:MAG: helix-turn-helix domain-containing protein [Campylobacteraceae bacterium]|jgi:SOS-response transcriptional repressor LexA|nr:helix-turn-helix domain-containing protein [Campylobacteraceae bacterium]